MIVPDTSWAKTVWLKASAHSTKHESPEIFKVICCLWQIRPDKMMSSPTPARLCYIKIEIYPGGWWKHMEDRPLRLCLAR